MNAEETAALVALLGIAPDGVRIEFGVLAGETLKLIAEHDGRTVGVDSFCGMPPSTERDKKGGKDPYPEGRLSCPMSRAMRISNTNGRVRLIQGFVPDVLADIAEDKIAFAHVDMDQYDSTLAALRWLETRMVAGGIICCDDWIEDRDWLAAGAVNEFAKTRAITGHCGRKAWFVFQ